MHRKKTPEKNTPLLELEKAVSEVLITNGRSLEPFIKVFHYQGDNVTQKSLGALVGVFEVDEKSEDSAYIVNFLASVAKKEYFGNPRRGAIESFEATLHKVNLALAELVKHGNVSWLGKFHGSLCVLEKNHIHFSVTGQSAILLWRNEAFTDISDGLASEESHVHPIKTFVEISSGRLDLDDRIIVASPELLALFSLEDLRKNALRMDRDRFTQFLRTALVNELDMAGIVVIDFVAAQPVAEEKSAPRKPKHDQNIYRNVFSETTFVKKPEEISSTERPVERTEPPRTEYVDTKTGHIYVQGDTLEQESSHPFWERTQLILSDLGGAISSFLADKRRLLRKGRKKSVILFALFLERSGTVSRRGLRALRRQTRHLKDRLAASREKEEEKRKQEETDLSQASHPDTPREESFPVPEPENIPEEPQKKEVKTEEETFLLPENAPEEEKKEHVMTTLPDRTLLKTKLASFYAPKREQAEGPRKTFAAAMEHSLEKAGTLWNDLKEKCSPKNVRLPDKMEFSFPPQAVSALKNLPERYRSLSPEKKKYLLAGSTVIILVGGTFLLLLPLLTRPTAENAPAPATSSETPASPLSGEKNLRTVTLSAIQETSDEIVTPLMLHGEPFLVTKHGIIQENDTFSLPTADQVVLAAAMEDLRLIFLFTEKKSLYAWSPLTRTYVQNSLSLPDGATIRDMGSYLTYLYFFDSTGKQIYRFPRATGGFGEPTPWLKENLELGESSSMAVGSDIFLFSQDSLRSYSRGRTASTLESPVNPLGAILLTAPEESSFLYALDRNNRRILVWNRDGSLVAQYAAEQFSQATGLSVSDDGSQIFVSTPHTLYSFKSEM